MTDALAELATFDKMDDPDTISHTEFWQLLEEQAQLLNLFRNLCTQLQEHCRQHNLTAETQQFCDPHGTLLMGCSTETHRLNIMHGPAFAENEGGTPCPFEITLTLLDVTELDRLTWQSRSNTSGVKLVTAEDTEADELAPIRTHVSQEEPADMAELLAVVLDHLT